jgi:hypothetical protein
MKRTINHNTAHMPVQSSTMRSAGYDELTGNFHVAFNDGGNYVYHDVPPDVHEAFQMASSKGRFLHTNVRNRYEFTKL